jgi:hypothetical protein
MGRLVLILLFLTVAFAAPTAEEFDDRVWKFQRNWDRFLRAHWGCPIDAHNRADCDAGQGHPDLKAFRSACEEARKLFMLEGTCY